MQLGACWIYAQVRCTVSSLSFLMFIKVSNSYWSAIVILCGIYNLALHCNETASQMRPRPSTDRLFRDWQLFTPLEYPTLKLTSELVVFGYDYCQGAYYNLEALCLYGARWALHTNWTYSNHPISLKLMSSEVRPNIVYSVRSRLSLRRTVVSVMETRRLNSSSCNPCEANSWMTKRIAKVGTRPLGWAYAFMFSFLLYKYMYIRN